MKRRLSKADYEYYKLIVLQEIPDEPCEKHHRTIASNVGLTPVQVRDTIRLLREEGYPICSNSHEGYWMARNSSEIQEVINMFNSYINSMQSTVEALQDTKFKRMKKEGLI